MSLNPYIKYYVNQAGTGIGGFEGARFQKGHGFFGNVFKSAILPLLKYLGPKALSLGADVATDAITGENILSSLKTRGKSTAQNIAGDIGSRVTRFAQTGEGKRRKSKRSTKRKIRKSKNPVKRSKRNISTKRTPVKSVKSSVFL